MLMNALTSCSSLLSFLPAFFKNFAESSHLSQYYVGISSEKRQEFNEPLAVKFITDFSVYQYFLYKKIFWAKKYLSAKSC